MTIVPAWQYKLFPDIRKRFSDCCRQTGVARVVEIDEFAVLSTLYLRKFWK